MIQICLLFGFRVVSYSLEEEIAPKVLEASNNKQDKKCP